MVGEDRPGDRSPGPGGGIGAGGSPEVPAAAEALRQGSPPGELIWELSRRGIAAGEAERIVRQAQAEILREEFAAGRKRLGRGAFWFFGAAALRMASYLSSEGRDGFLLGWAAMVWGGLEMARGYFQARRVAGGESAERLRRWGRFLLIGILATGTLGYWMWYLVRFHRSRLISRWEVNSRSLQSFDILEGRLFQELDDTGTDEEWLTTWSRYAPRLAGFREPFQRLLKTGERLERVLRDEGERTRLREDLRVVGLYLREVDIYDEIRVLFSQGRPGDWPDGLGMKLLALEAVLDEIRGATDPETGGGTGGNPGTRGSGGISGPAGFHPGPFPLRQVRTA